MLYLCFQQGDPMPNLVPIVLEQTSKGERSYDIQPIAQRPCDHAGHRSE